MSKPSLPECLSTPEANIVDISIEHWNPQDHHENLLKNTPCVVLPAFANQTVDIGAHEATSSMCEDENTLDEDEDTLDDPFHAHFTTHEDEFFHEDEEEFFDTEEEEFFDTEEKEEPEPTKRGGNDILPSSTSKPKHVSMHGHEFHITMQCIPNAKAFNRAVLL